MFHPCECTTAMLRTSRSCASCEFDATIAPSSPLGRRGPALSEPSSGVSAGRVSISSQSSLGPISGSSGSHGRRQLNEPGSGFVTESEIRFSCSSMSGASRW